LKRFAIDVDDNDRMRRKRAKQHVEEIDAALAHNPGKPNRFSVQIRIQSASADTPTAAGRRPTRSRS